MRLVPAVLLATMLAGAAPAWAAGECPALPRRTPMPREAVAESIDQPDWQQRVAALDAQLPSLQLASRRLVFLGDSLTAGWDPGLFSQFYGTRNPVLLGVIGDYTQGILDRLPREWGPLRPRLVVLLVGTNNTRWGRSKPEDVALGVAEIVRLIHAKSSGTRVLIVGILPTSADASDPLRAINAQANALMARCADGQTTFYTDIGRSFVNAAGELSNEVSFDGTHLTPVGYALMAMALEPDIKRLMGE
jgi:beta-glucosidase